MLRHVLLLTATIAPPAHALDLARIDVDTRRRDYAIAFEQHLDALTSGLVEGIVFAENSGSDLTFLEAAVERRSLRKRVEFLSFSDLDARPELGRAFGEIRIITHAMDCSRLIAGEPEPLVWKITGRYTIQNLDRLVRSCPQPLDLYCNMRDFPRRWVDMYLMAWSKRGFDVFLREAGEAIRVGLPTSAAGVSPEELLRVWLDARRSAGVLIPRFRHTALIDGIRGYDNRSYAEANRWKTVLRRAMLRTAPHIWI